MKKDFLKHRHELMHSEQDETPEDEANESPDIQEMEEEMGTERHANNYNRKGKKFMRKLRKKGGEE